MPNTLAIPLDNGDGGLCADLDRELDNMDALIVGQSVRSDGMPMLHIQVKDRDDIRAEINVRRILTHYSPQRIAA